MTIVSVQKATMVITANSKIWLVRFHLQKQTKKIRMNMSLVSNLLFRPIFWKL